MDREITRITIRDWLPSSSSTAAAPGARRRRRRRIDSRGPSSRSWDPSSKDLLRRRRRRRTAGATLRRRDPRRHRRAALLQLCRRRRREPRRLQHTITDHVISDLAECLPEVKKPSKNERSKNPSKIIYPVTHPSESSCPAATAERGIALLLFCVGERARERRGGESVRRRAVVSASGAARCEVQVQYIGGGCGARVSSAPPVGARAMRGEPSARRRAAAARPRLPIFSRCQQRTAHGPVLLNPIPPSPYQPLRRTQSLGPLSFAAWISLLLVPTVHGDSTSRVVFIFEKGEISERFLFIYFWISGSAADAVEYRSRGARRRKLFSGCAGGGGGRRGAARRGGMDTMRGALERARMLVGMEVDEESAPEEQSFFDDVTRNCALTTTQASAIPTPPTQPGSIRVPRSDLVDASSDCSSKCGWLIVLKSWCLFLESRCRGCTASRYAWLPDWRAPSW